MSQLYVFSVITGEVYPIQQEDIPTLFNYQILITQVPRPSCKKCYGRGYAFREEKTGFYQMCSCIGTKIHPSVDIQNIKIEMPRIG
jgi:hypothetical protein